MQAKIWQFFEANGAQKRHRIDGCFSLIINALCNLIIDEARIVARR